MYTIDTDCQAVEVGNYLTDWATMMEVMPVNMQPEQFAASYDPNNYTMCREANPHDLSPPCTYCVGALQDEGNICRLDAEMWGSSQPPCTTLRVVRPQIP